MNLLKAVAALVSGGALGTPSSGTLTNCTGLPVAGGGTGATTFTDAGVLIGNGTGALQATTAGTAGQVLTSNGAGVDPTFQAAAAGFTLGTAVASTSGTAITFTGIPSGTKRIDITFKGVSTNGTSNYLIQIGDSGGIETTGYLGAGNDFSTAANYTSGFGIFVAAAAAVLHGVITLMLENSGAFSWVAYGLMMRSDTTAAGYATGGSKSTSAELDRVSITTVNGTDVFDAGEINIQYQ